MITQQEVIDFCFKYFSTKNKEALIPLLRSFLEDQSNMKMIELDIKNNIKGPYFMDGLTERMFNRINSHSLDTSELGDISDRYTFILNSDIISDETLTLYDLEQLAISGTEVRYLRIYINWFLPLYYMDIHSELGDGKNLNYYKISNLSDYESGIIMRIKHLVTKHNLQTFDNDFFFKRFEGLTTDCSEYDNANIFDCLFSDISYPYDDLIEQRN